MNEGCQECPAATVFDADLEALDLETAETFYASLTDFQYQERGSTSHNYGKAGTGATAFKLVPRSDHKACVLTGCPQGTRPTGKTAAGWQGCYMCPSGSYWETATTLAMDRPDEGPTRCNECAFPRESSPKGPGATACTPSVPLIIGATSGATALLLICALIAVCRRVHRIQKAKSAADLANIVGAARAHEMRRMSLGPDGDMQVELQALNADAVRRMSEAVPRDRQINNPMRSERFMRMMTSGGGVGRGGEEQKDSANAASTGATTAAAGGDSDDGSVNINIAREDSWNTFAMQRNPIFPPAAAAAAAASTTAMARVNDRRSVRLDTGGPPLAAEEPPAAVPVAIPLVNPAGSAAAQPGGRRLRDVRQLVEALDSELGTEAHAAGADEGGANEDGANEDGANDDGINDDGANDDGANGGGAGEDCADESDANEDGAD